MHEDEGSYGIQLIQKCYWDRDRNQYHHEHGVKLVDALEHVIRSQDDEDKKGFGR